MSQKYIIFKIAKNMGTTINTILELNKNRINYVKLLSEKDFIKKKIEDATIIFIAHQSCIIKFKKNFRDIYDKSIKIIIFRNPLLRLESSYNYMRNYKYKKPLSYYLKNIVRDPQNIKDCIGKNYCAFFVHFETTQADAIDYKENEYHTKNYIWLLMDNINKIFNFFKDKLNLNIKNNLHENKTKLKSGKKIKIKKMDIPLFINKFKDDIILYKKIKNIN